MAQLEHLKLLRLPEQFERRKKPGFGSVVQRQPVEHSEKLRAELNQSIAEQQRRRATEHVDPSLILRVKMTGALLEDDWERLGLTLLSSDADRTLILFSSSDEMTEFRGRLEAYQREIPIGQKAPSYAGFIGGIEEISAVQPRDRIGLRLREEGISNEEDFDVVESYILDIELWDLGRPELRLRKITQISDYLTAMGGEAIDQYNGPSITMLRAKIRGAVVRALLALDDIATIDLPPQPDHGMAEAIALTLEALPEIGDLNPDSPLIGIIDSGINDHPLLANAVVGSIGVPATLGTADDWGHGTKVGGIAMFGDLRSHLALGQLPRSVRLVSAKVLNEFGEFDERRLVPSQMREAITTLHARYGCRIFIVALGDKRRTYDGGKVGPWASTLDELASELDVVIIVSAGNRIPRGGNRLEQAVTDYPSYLMEPANRFCEPTGAVNVLTVGSLAHGEGLNADFDFEVGVRSITRALEPSPFTRIGPGIDGSTKPEVVDIGGTVVFDPAVARLRGGGDLEAAGVLTLNNRFLEHLFVSGSGTSYAAPLVGHKASQLLAKFPDASANLVRALLVGAAKVPEEAYEKLQALGNDAVRAICGYGRIDSERATYSDTHRVVFFTEDELPMDHFAVYHIPIPEVFQSGGKRSIRVSLAFDPPVRHTRADYIGASMSFRLVRGCDPALIFEHYRRRTNDEDDVPDLEKKFNCDLKPGPQEREAGTLQTATVSFSRETVQYGEDYYLVVRCEGGWASGFQPRQRFAVVVELTHQAQVQLYDRMRARLRVTT